MAMRRKLIAVVPSVMPALLVLIRSKTGMKRKLIAVVHFANLVHIAMITFKMERRKELIAERLLDARFVVSISLVVGIFILIIKYIFKYNKG